MACGEAVTEYEIAMVTDSGGIDDKSFNQGTWEGIIRYADANGKTYKYYKPSEISDAAYLAAISLAVEGGAKIVVTPGFLFETSIYEAQTMYPDVKFVLIDGDAAYARLLDLFDHREHPLHPVR
ncbi:MAG: BMP family ABC transporter substrate-binding protein [Desulfomicrobium escambiense]|nr:BMP family ABC transporter substrate-binding protein [Desulfomicrobium escambiense]